MAPSLPRSRFWKRLRWRLTETRWDDTMCYVDVRQSATTETGMHYLAINL